MNGRAHQSKSSSAARSEAEVIRPVVSFHGIGSKEIMVGEWGGGVRRDGREVQDVMKRWKQIK